MKAKAIKLLIVLPSLLQGAAMFLYTGRNQSNDYTLLFGVACLLAFLFCLLTRLHLGTIVITITIGGIIALISKIIVDMQVDPTSHNLLPFEIVITACIACIAALIGAVLGKMIRKAPK